MVVFVIVITIFLVAISLNEFYFRIVLWDTLANRIKQEDDNKFKCIAIGSTYCRYSIADKKSIIFNIGIDGQFFYYTNKFLRHYAPKFLNTGGTVYIICADLAFACVGKGMYGPGKYIGLLSRDELGDDYSFRRFIGYRFPLFTNPKSIKGLVGYLVKGKRSAFIETMVNPFSEEEVYSFSQKRCKSWCNQFGLKDTQSAEISNELEEEFAKTRKIVTGMVDYCLKSGYKPVLVVAPLSGIMNSMISNEFIDKVLFSNIRQANTQDVQFLNYLRDKRFDDYRLYYRSGDCLNARGRKMFTEILLADTI